MGTGENANSYDALSDSDLQGQIGSAEAELKRRAALPAAEQRARMERELGEIEAGTRNPGQEHLRAVSPQTVAKWTEEGRLAHMGVGGRKKRYA
jgi:hypothetical protein